MVKTLTAICTFRLLKLCRKVRREFGLTKMLLKSSFNATTHNRQVSTQEVIANLGCSVLPHLPYSPDLDPSEFSLFGALKVSFVGEGLGVTTTVLKKGKRGCECKIQPGAWRRQVLFFLLAPGCLFDGYYVEQDRQCTCNVTVRRV